MIFRGEGTHESCIAGIDHDHRRRRRLRRYFYFSNQFLDKVLFPPRGPNAGRNINRANAIRPWLFLFPAMFALGLYLAYPVFETLRLSLTDRSAGGAFVGLANYAQMFGEDKFWEAVINNLMWLLIVPADGDGLRRA
jgi:alpha-glucoside transport system permease protein